MTPEERGDAFDPEPETLDATDESVDAMDVDFEDEGETDEEAGVPQVVMAPCPDCGDDTPHAILHGTLGTKGGYTLDATAQCEECDRVHHVLLREPAPVQVNVVVSWRADSTKTSAWFAPTDSIRVGDEFVMNERRVQVTGIELPSGKRVPSAQIADLRTVWAKDFETVKVPFAINLKRRTVAKHQDVDPEEEYTVGQEVVFGRLRVTIHAIKTDDGVLTRGTTKAREISRVFAKPTPLGKSYRPPPEIRARMRMGRAFENM